MARRDVEIGGKPGQVPMRPLSAFEVAEHVLGDFLRWRWLRPVAWEPENQAFMPRVDIIERDDTLIVRAELPGFTKEDIEVVVSGSTLTIRGEPGMQPQEESDDFLGAARRGAFFAQARAACQGR